ncbi:MAG: hypothetical protein ABWZ65_16020, partial [Pseudomonas mandelii]
RRKKPQPAAAHSGAKSAQARHATGQSSMIFQEQKQWVIFCLIRACSRWAAKQPQNLQLNYTRKTVVTGMGVLRTPTGASSLATGFVSLPVEDVLPGKPHRIVIAIGIDDP